MSNPIATFGQFHTALTALANRPSVGVVPLGLGADGSFLFGPQGTAMPTIKPMLNIERLKDSGADSEIERLFRASRDSDLFERLTVLRSVFDNRMGVMIPPAEAHRAGLGRMIEQVAHTLRPEREEGGVFDVEEAAGALQPEPSDEVAPSGDRVFGDKGPFSDSEFNAAAEFSRLTVGDLAERLSTVGYLQGGGYGHADLADALLARGQSQAREVSGLVAIYPPDSESSCDPTELMFAAGALYANIRAPWALNMAEQAFSAAAVEFLQFPRPDNISAAILYELQAELHDRRRGEERSNPMRSMAAGQWLMSLVLGRDGESWKIRIFRGLANSWLAGRMDLYSELAQLSVRRALEESPPVVQAGFLIRSTWAVADHVRSAGVEEPGNRFWTVAMARLGAASKRLEESGDAEALDMADWLVDAALRSISVPSPRG